MYYDRQVELRVLTLLNRGSMSVYLSICILDLSEKDVKLQLSVHQIFRVSSFYELGLTRESRTLAVLYVRTNFLQLCCSYY